MKSLHDAVSEIQRTKWTFNNNFDVRLEMESPLASECGLRNLDVNLYIKGFEVPQVGVSSFIEHYVLDRHRVAMGIWEPVVFTFNFRDFNNLELYNKFVKYVSGEREAYFDDYKFKISLYKLADHLDDEEEKLVLQIDNCYITTVSALKFSNDSEAQVLEFDVQVKSATSVDPIIV